MNDNDKQYFSDMIDSHSEKIIKANNQRIDKIYSQLESLSWLQKVMKLKGSLPPLRGWAASPDILLKLHAHILKTQPKTVVELGSGSSTIVIADALRQNGFGSLVSIEHSQSFAEKSLALLEAESLNSWVDLRVGVLEPWSGMHINAKSEKHPSMWYSEYALKNIEYIDLLLVDGPPAATCQFARYPAMPAFIDYFSDKAQVWMDDAARRDEKTICKQWSDDYGFELEYFALDKGLGILSRK